MNYWLQKLNALLTTVLTTITAQTTALVNVLQGTDTNQLTWSTMQATESGTVTAGALWLKIENKGAVNAAFGGITLVVGADPLELPYIPGKHYPAINYNPGVAGVLEINEIR